MNQIKPTNQNETDRLAEQNVGTKQQISSPIGTPKFTVENNSNQNIDSSDLRSSKQFTSVNDKDLIATSKSENAKTLTGNTNQSQSSVVDSKLTESIFKSGEINTTIDTKLTADSDKTTTDSSESENKGTESTEQSESSVPKAGIEFVAKFLLPILKLNPRISGVKLYQILNNRVEKIPILDSNLDTKFANDSKTRPASKDDLAITSDN